MTARSHQILTLGAAQAALRDARLAASDLGHDKSWSRREHNACVARLQKALYEAHQELADLDIAISHELVRLLHARRIVDSELRAASSEPYCEPHGDYQRVLALIRLHTAIGSTLTGPAVSAW